MSDFPRSSRLIDRNRSTLLVVDVQEKLIASIRNRAELIWNIRRLVDAAQLFSVPVVATEQYPKGLGPTVAELKERISIRIEKTAFSCRECGSIWGNAIEQCRRQVVVVGIEAHVCVQQTVIDLLSIGFDVFVAANAIGSRFDVDRDTAIMRMHHGGAVMTTAESVMFEWCDTSSAANFKELSKLVRESGPA